jgi:FixJ family two-component response regulator
MATLLSVDSPFWCQLMRWFCPHTVLRMGHLHTVPVISIVDDDESVRAATGSLVRSLGFKAHTFASAEEFLRSQHVDETSCLIADIKMPGISGIELQGFVHAGGRRTPIIFITAFPEERIRVRAMRAGAIGFLSKPFDVATLIKCLDLALQSNDSVAQN